MKRLRVNNLAMSYGNGRVLDDFSLEIAGAGVHAVVGESGSGKTTLLRIIAGLIKPDAGSVYLDDDDLTEYLPEKRNMGLVFQDYALFPHLSVFQNIAYGLLGLSRKACRERVQELLDAVGLPAIAGRYPGELSGGQQQRVAIARALAPQPRLMLFDEPFSNLDPLRRAKLRDMIRKLSEQTGTTSLIVTHDISDAAKLADTIAVMKEGVLVQQGSATLLAEEPASDYVASLMAESGRA